MGPLAQGARLDEFGATTLDDAIASFPPPGDRPRSEMGWALDHWNEAGPRFTAMLDAHAGGDGRTAGAENALFITFHLQAVLPGAGPRSAPSSWKGLGKGNGQHCPVPYGSGPGKAKDGPCGLLHPGFSRTGDQAPTSTRSPDPGILAASRP